MAKSQFIDKVLTSKSPDRKKSMREPVDYRAELLGKINELDLSDKTVR